MQVDLYFIIIIFLKHKADCSNLLCMKENRLYLKLNKQFKSNAKIKYGINTDLPVGEGSIFQVNWAWLLHWIHLEFASSNPGDKDMNFGPAGLFWTWRCMLHLLLNQVLFLIPTKVSGQHIPEVFLKETRVIVVIGAKGFLLC